MSLICKAYIKYMNTLGLLLDSEFCGPFGAARCYFLSRANLSKLQSCYLLNVLITFVSNTLSKSKFIITFLCSFIVYLN